MAMRYIYRRPTPEDYADLRQEIPGLDAQLGTAAENLRRFIRVPFNPMRHVQYTFLTKKVGTGWAWVCPGLELVAEDENGLFALTDHFKIPRPSFIAHAAQ